MRKRGRPQDELTEEDLRAWQEVEVDGLWERMQRVPPQDQLAWMRREWTLAVERYVRRRERWLRATTAQDVLEDVLEAVTRVAAGELDHRMQAMVIDRAFNSRGLCLATDLFVERAADEPWRVRELGGPVHWSVCLVARATGVSAYALRQHRVHRLRERAGVVDTLAPGDVAFTDEDLERLGHLVRAG